VNLSAAGQIDLTNLPTPPAGATGMNVYIDGKLSNTAGPVSGSTYTISAASSSTQAVPSTPTSEWNWSATDSGGNPVGGGTVSFDGSGNPVPGTAQTISLANVDGSSTPQNVTLDFSGLTQVAGQSSAAPLTVNGSSPGVLQSFNIDDTGTITGVFSNGVTQDLGQVAMASFQNPEGLSSSGNNQYNVTPDSGNPTVGTSGTNGMGSIADGYVEQSNVDLSNEFTNMIVSQRGFEANTKIVSTVNTLLSDVIGLIQG
jgi:flagellar hook protein FlgE